MRQTENLAFKVIFGQLLWHAMIIKLFQKKNDDHVPLVGIWLFRVTHLIKHNVIMVLCIL